MAEYKPAPNLTAGDVITVGDTKYRIDVVHEWTEDGAIVSGYEIGREPGKQSIKNLIRNEIKGSVQYHGDWSS